ncbi:hypothetical protein HMPREF9141_1459 [Prevotella multiformis DSM 16608]|uniref:Uncharacterized protein n=1 Tax=Prevotella multiformis DSM 16608 TaxID=888743 RepID=F0F792_9BACT|nr:hypothetical protein HMPREF9141_1459 [Prevotella multiformis DSM 16608]
MLRRAVGLSFSGQTIRGRIGRGDGDGELGSRADSCCRLPVL